MAEEDLLRQPDISDAALQEKPLTRRRYWIVSSREAIGTLLSGGISGSGVDIEGCATDESLSELLTAGLGDQGAIPGGVGPHKSN